jgi:hypothetical protein
LDRRDGEGLDRRKAQVLTNATAEADANQETGHGC